MAEFFFENFLLVRFSPHTQKKKTFYKIWTSFFREKVIPIVSRPSQTAQVGERPPATSHVFCGVTKLPKPLYFVCRVRCTHTEGSVIMIIGDHHTRACSTHLTHTDFGACHTSHTRWHRERSESVVGSRTGKHELYGYGVQTKIKLHMIRGTLAFPKALNWSCTYVTVPGEKQDNESRRFESQQTLKGCCHTLHDTMCVCVSDKNSRTTVFLLDIYISLRVR